MYILVGVHAWMLLYWDDLEYPAVKQSSGESCIEAGVVANHAFLKALKRVDSLHKEDLHIRLAYLVNLEIQACNSNDTQEEF